MKIKKNCEWCGKEYLVKLYRQIISKYCSKKCMENSQKNRRIKKICPYCKQKFDIPLCFSKRKFCSTDCRVKYWREDSKRICKFCGKVFYRQSANCKNGKGQYCSRSCYNKSQYRFSNCKICGIIFHKKGNRTVCLKHRYMSIKNRRASIKLETHYQAICPICGETFLWKKTVNTGGSIYCSQKCHYAAARKEKVSRICKHCGKIFYMHERRIKLEKGYGTFCSRKCFRLHYRGVNHPQYTSYKVKCYQCGNEFIKQPCQVTNKNFCSRKCSNQYWFKRKNLNLLSPTANIKMSIRRNCLGCGKSFLISICHFYDRFYCSKKCQWNSKIWKQKCRNLELKRWNDDKFIYNVFKGFHFRKIENPIELDKQIIEAKVSLFKFKRRLENEQKYSGTVLGSG